LVRLVPTPSPSLGTLVRGCENEPQTFPGDYCNSADDPKRILLSRSPSPNCLTRKPDHLSHGPRRYDPLSRDQCIRGWGDNLARRAKRSFFPLLACSKRSGREHSSRDPRRNTSLKQPNSTQSGTGVFRTKPALPSYAGRFTEHSTRNGLYSELCSNIGDRSRFRPTLVRELFSKQQPGDRLSETIRRTRQFKNRGSPRTVSNPGSHLSTHNE